MGSSKKAEMQEEKKEIINIKGNEPKSAFIKLFSKEDVNKKLSNALYELIAKSTFADESLDEIFHLAFKNVSGMRLLNIYFYDDSQKALDPYLSYGLQEGILTCDHLSAVPTYIKALGIDLEVPLGMYWDFSKRTTYKFNLIPHDFNIEKKIYDTITEHSEFNSGIALPLLFQKKLIGFIEGVGQNLKFDNDQGRIPINLILYMASIARTVATHIELQTDPLTNLKTRRHFDMTLSKYITKNIQENKRFSLIYIDGDHFKKINDIHGHNAGDVVLRFIAKQLSFSTRDNECEIFRLGGEEFAIIADTDLEVAKEISKRICKNVHRKVRAKNNKGELQIIIPSVSIGITEFNPSNVNGNKNVSDIAEALKRQADNALYTAKVEYGRNCVVVRKKEEGRIVLLKVE